MSAEQQDTEQQEMMDYEQLLEMGVVNEIPQEQELTNNEKLEDIQ